MFRISKSACLGAFLAGGLVLWAASTANATLILQLERIDDSTAILTATGTAAAGASFLAALDVASIGDSGDDSSFGDFAIGGNGITQLFIGVDTTTLFLGFGTGNVVIGAAPTGAETITLDVETWSAVGAGGDLSFGQGTWVMVGTVPEPSTLAIFALGLAGLGFFMTRRRRVV